MVARQKIRPANYRRGFISVNQVFITVASSDDDDDDPVAFALQAYLQRVLLEPLRNVRTFNPAAWAILRGVIYKRNDTTMMRDDKLDSKSPRCKIRVREGKRGEKQEKRRGKTRRKTGPRGS